MKNKYRLLLAGTMLLALLFLAGCVPFTGGVQEVLPPLGGERVEHQYIVLFDGTPDKATMEAVINAAGGELINDLPQVGIAVAYSTDPGFAALMAMHPLVGEISPDIKVFLDLPDLPAIEPMKEPLGEVVDWYEDAFFYHRFQWHIRRVGGDMDTWAVQKGTHDVIVAILDTGVWSEHRDIAPNYIAHILGYAVPGTEGRFSRSFIPFGLDYGDPRDFHSHGTLVAGTVAARGATLGVGPGLAIANYKVLGRWGGGARSWVLAGIIAAVDDGVHVINMSLRGWGLRGEAGWLAYQRVVDYAWRNNVLIIAAAGNDELDQNAIRPWISLPSGLRQVVSVSATGPHDELAVYSDYGLGAVGIEITAPGGSWPEVFFSGWHIKYLTFAPLSNWGRPPGNWWGWWAGTSAAAPHVAGVAGLIIAQNPGIHVSQVRAILTGTAEFLDPRQYFGHGMVRADYAVGR